MCSKQSQLKNSLSHLFCVNWQGYNNSKQERTYGFSRLNIVMADIKYVDHVRIELETQVFRIRFMDYLSIHDHLSYSQISNYIQQRYIEFFIVKIRSI